MTLASNYPEGFSAASRIWIYQADRAFSTAETGQIKNELDKFTAGWLSHGQKVKGASMVLPEGFVILIADQSVSEVSGCSTDSSVRIIKELEQQFSLGLFNRQALAFYIDNEVVRIPVAEMATAISNKQVQRDTLYFNNMIQTLDELKTSWLVPAAGSWLSKKFRAEEHITA